LPAERLQLLYFFAQHRDMTVFKIAKLEMAACKLEMAAAIYCCTRQGDSSCQDGRVREMAAVYIAITRQGNEISACTRLEITAALWILLYRDRKITAFKIAR